MKQLILSLLAKAARSPLASRFLEATLQRGADFYARAKLLNLPGAEGQAYDAFLAKLTQDLTVRRGPFVGIKYPGRKAAGSAFVPKLLGSYENELHETLERLLAKNYPTVVDVGCAEGYYAVGMALRLPACQVVAYDVDFTARRLCASMAQLNGVADRVSIQEHCGADTLNALAGKPKHLIICDCEGYEKQLFTQQNLPALRGHDLLIEMHDFIDPTISPYLIELFQSTHRQSIIRSEDDLYRPRGAESTYPELAGLSLSVQRKALSEGRPRIMEWLILESLE